MRVIRLALLTTCVTAAALAISAGIAGASRGIEPAARAVRASGTFKFREINGNEVVCPMTLDAEIHRTIPKTVGALTGTVTELEVEEEECETTGVSSRLVFSALRLPWHIRYVSFQGSLPRIRSIRVTALGVNLLFRITIIEFFRAGCEYRTDLQLDFEINSTSEVERVRIVPGQRVPLERALEGAEFCPTQGEPGGDFAPPAPVRIRLLP
ncbi:MAG: hypothetical protein WBC33_12610 [Conexibacter sp.]